MPIHLLTPRHLQAPDWKLSTHRKPVQIEAASEDAARQRAAKLYCSAPLPPGRVDPWTQTTLARAKVVAEVDPAVTFAPSP
jgi:hypothetical protein